MKIIALCLILLFIIGVASAEVTGGGIKISNPYTKDIGNGWISYSFSTEGSGTIVITNNGEVVQEWELDNYASGAGGSIDTGKDDSGIFNICFSDKSNPQNRKCSTIELIIVPDTVDILISSYPMSAIVSYNNEIVGITPFVFNMPDVIGNLVFEKKGYETLSVGISNTQTQVNVNMVEIPKATPTPTPTATPTPAPTPEIIKAAEAIVTQSPTPVPTQVKELSMTSQEGWINFTTVPPGAKIFINGNYLGTTPRTRDLVTGIYAFEYQLEGYRNISMALAIKDGKETPFHVVLEKLVIENIPSSTIGEEKIVVSAQNLSPVELPRDDSASGDSMSPTTNDTNNTLFYVVVTLTTLLLAASLLYFKTQVNRMGKARTITSDILSPLVIPMSPQDDSEDVTPLDKSLHEKIMEAYEENPDYSNAVLARKFGVSERTIQRNK